MNNYYICVQPKGSQGYIVIKGPSSLEEIDRTTTSYKDREQLIMDYKRNIPSLPSSENVESVFIRKEGETKGWNLGEVFYLENNDVINREKNKEELIEKTKDVEFLKQFLRRYIIIAEQERGYVPFEEKVNQFIACIEEEAVDCHAKFVELLEEMMEHYGIYRFVYSVNKTFEEEKDKTSGKIKIKKISGTARRIKRTH